MKETVVWKLLFDLAVKVPTFIFSTLSFLFILSIILPLSFLWPLTPTQLTLGSYSNNSFASVIHFLCPPPTLQPLSVPFLLPQCIISPPFYLFSSFHLSAQPSRLLLLSFRKHFGCTERFFLEHIFKWMQSRRAGAVTNLLLDPQILHWACTLNSFLFYDEVWLHHVFPQMQLIIFLPFYFNLCVLCLLLSLTMIAKSKSFRLKQQLKYKDVLGWNKLFLIM